MRFKKEKFADKKLVKALQYLIDVHGTASTIGDGVAEVSYFLNEIVIKTQTDAYVLNAPLGSTLPVIVVVAHGEIVEELIKLIKSKVDDVEHQAPHQVPPTEIIQ